MNRFAHIARICLLEARSQFRNAIRMPAFAFPTLIFPLMFYAFFGIVLFGARDGNTELPTMMLAGYGVFAVLGPSLFGFGVGLANERDNGSLLLKQTTPMPTGAYLFSRVAMAFVFGAVVTLGLFLLGALGAGVQLSAGEWAGLFGVILSGVIPICSLGLMIGTLVKVQAAVAVVNLVFLPMSVLSGLWFPIALFPEVLQRVANVLPAYHLAQLALKVIGLDQGQPVLLHIGILAVQTAVFLVVAAIGFRRFGRLNPA